ncbi:MAG TPA: DUF3300 domain-containing protein [Bryobacteraceae bacterium]|nr:DUF3300 domain-containing protein [Bryobacteraceae bacterium]
MSKTLAVCVIFAFLAGVPVWSQDDTSYQPFSPEEMDNLLAPIALYPDPLLAQVLPAATFPDQIDEAARFVRAGATTDSIDVQPWDVSVKAVAHYPTVLYMMADQLDWTTALGQAWVNQSDDVMASIQRLRREAEDAGNLVSTPEAQVVDDDGGIDIWPAQPDYCYVPVYDPGIVYYGSGGSIRGPVIAYGPAMPIGVWLIYDFDWHHKRIYYHGWSIMNGWVVRARPYIRVSNVYVSNVYKNVNVNRSVVTRPVSHNNLARFNRSREGAAYGSLPANSGAGSMNNKIIQRNMNVNDTRVDAFRGRSAAPPATVQRAEPPARVPERPGNAAFGENRSSFGARAASERGQSSRESKPAPAPRSSGGGGSHGGGGSGGGSHSGGGGGGGGSHGGGGGGGSHSSGGGSHHK